MFLFFGVTAFHVVRACGCKPQSRLRTTWQKRAHTWTPDLALCKESDGDVLRALLHGTLRKIQKIIDTGYIVLRTYYVRARVIIGGDSPWLRHLLGLSTYFGVDSVYTFATWCRELKKWSDTELPRTTKFEKTCAVCTLVVQLPWMPAVAPRSHFCTSMTVIILL